MTIEEAMNIDKEREALRYWLGCWDAAEVEGLQEAVREAKAFGGAAGLRLADLVERRISHGAEKARAALDEQKAGPSDDLGTIITTLESLRATLQAYRLGEYADMLLAALKTTRALRSKYAAPVMTPELEAEEFTQAAIDNSPEPLRRLGEYLTHVLEEDQWATAERMLLSACAAQVNEQDAKDTP